jgi:hypothetical protein
MFRRLAIVVALVLVSAACTDSAGTTTTTSDDPSTSTTGDGVTTTSAPGGATTTSAGPPQTTAPDLSGLEGLSDEVKAQLIVLIGAAQEIRGLAFLEPPKIRVVSDDELEALVRADIEEQSEDFPADEALYKMLGLLADTADFEQLLLDLYGEQVAGFYDGDIGEIVVPAREDGLSVLQQGTMVHELVHALTDQHFVFHEEFQRMIDEDRLDEATAYQALIEGDAVLAEVLWVQTLADRELGEFIADSLDIDTAALDAAPRFIKESLLFPYDTGLAFAQTLYVDDAWASVNDAYGTLAGLPGSSEQVITPDDYTRDLPVEVPIPEVSITGYELERTSVWGEQGIRIMLNQGAGVSTVAAAADGWGGDAYHQWFDGENAAMLLVFEGDTQSDLDELEAALLNFSIESFPEEHFAWVEQLDGALYFIAADVPAVGEQIRASVGLD